MAAINFFSNKNIHALVFLIFIFFYWNFSYAGSCKVVNFATLDAEQLQEEVNKRANFLKENHDLQIMIGDETPPKSVVSPAPRSCSDKPIGPGDRGMGSGAGANLRRPGFTKMATVRDGDKKIQIEVVGNADPLLIQSQFEAIKKLEKIEDLPIFKAVDSGDLQTLKKLISEGVAVRKVKDKIGQGGLVARAVSKWYEGTRSDSCELDKYIDRRDRIAEAYIAMVKVLVDAGADPSEIYSGASALWMLAGNIKGKRNPAGGLELGRYLLEHGVPLIMPGVKASVLDLLVERDNQELLDVVLRYGAPNQQLMNGALVTAVLSKNWKMSIHLLDTGADPNVLPSTFGKCCDKPIIDDVIIGSTVPRDLLKSLIAHKLNPNVILRTGYTPLMHVMHDHELMQALLAIGAKPNAIDEDKSVVRNSNGNTALHLASRVINSQPYGPGSYGFAYNQSNNPEIRARSVEMLLHYGAKPDVLNMDGMTPLMLTSADDAKSISLLLQAGATINPKAGRAKNYLQYNIPIGPITWALMEGNQTLATQWVQKYGELNITDCGALYYAARGGAVTTLNALLDIKAPSYVNEDQGESPLIGAAKAGHISTVKLLLDRHAATVNETNSITVMMVGGDGFLVPVVIRGRTALMGAVEGKHKAVVEELIRYGADVNMKDYTGRSAIDYARLMNAEDIVNVLEKAGAVSKKN